MPPENFSLHSFRDGQSVFVARYSANTRSGVAGIQRVARQTGMVSKNTRRNDSKSRWAAFLHILLLFFVAAIVTWSMWQTPALVSGHSAWKDVARLMEFDAAVRAGNLIPTWSPDLNSGYGSPVFQFYAPLVYYVTEVPVLMGFNYATALKVTWMLTLFASGLAMYRLASTYLSSSAACIGGIFYMLAPYRLVDVFVRHALAEHCAFIWLPLIVWGTERFATKLSRVGFVVGAIATAALILTHNVIALIALPVCFAVALAIATFTEDGRPKLSAWSLAMAGIVPLVGIGLAAFFWWPAIAGRGFTIAQESLTGGYYDFHRHFVRASQFLDTHWSFGTSGGGAEEQMPLQIGLLHLLAAIGSLAMLLARQQGKEKPGQIRVVWSVAGLGVMAVGIFMCLRWSQPVWQSMPLLKYVQFPWRFLAFVVFGSAMCATALGDRGMEIVSQFSNRRSQARNESTRHVATGCFAIIALIIAIMAAYFPYYSRVLFLTGDARTRSIARVSAEEMRTMQSAKVLIPFGLSVTGAELRQMNNQATADDFLPRDVLKRPDKPPTQVVHAEPGRIIESAEIRRNHYRARVEMSDAGKVELQQFWFPGWQGRVDRLPVATAPSHSQALVSCEVPTGEHVVEFSYSSLPQRRTGAIISLFSVAIGACVPGFLRQRLCKDYEKNR